MIKRLRDIPTPADRREAIRSNMGFSVPFLHRLRFTDDVLGEDDAALIDLLKPEGRTPARVLMFVDSCVAAAQSDLHRRLHELVDRHADRIELAGPIHTVPGGERCKNDRDMLYEVLKAIHDAHIDRMSYVLVIGGGAVLDCVGFAAAIAHRGVRLVRLPTTTLSQDDSGVGVKNGVNSFGKKNYLGAFSVPWAVINDRRLLTTLPERSWRAGFSEAVKVSLLKDAALFEKIEREAPAILARRPVAHEVIAASAVLHARHITEGGDPFELTTARPLDFGHWSAHKLEQLTDFEIEHGEAVAIGLALDVTYAELMGILAADAAARVRRVLVDLQLPTSHRMLGDSAALRDGLEEFREHLGGKLTITLIDRIGHALNVHHIDWPTMQRAAATLLDA